MAKGMDNAPKICNLYYSERGTCVLNQLSLQQTDTYVAFMKSSATRPALWV